MHYSLCVCYRIFKYDFAQMSVDDSYMGLTGLELRDLEAPKGEKICKGLMTNSVWAMGNK